MYAEVTVIVDGAMEDCEIFHNEALLANFVAEIEDEAEGHGYPTEVYVQYHDHNAADECECAQFETDHHPAYSFNYTDDEADDD
jgi:hypothetical protein